MLNRGLWISLIIQKLCHLRKWLKIKFLNVKKFVYLNYLLKNLVYALHSTPANYLALYHWGEVLFQQAKYTEYADDRIFLLKEAISKFQSALEMNSKFKYALLHSSEIYLTLAMNDKDHSDFYFIKASKMFIRAINEDFSYFSIFIDYLKKLLIEPTRAFQLRGVLILCKESAFSIPSKLSILECWGKAIISLVIHVNSLKRNELLKMVDEFCNAAVNTVAFSNNTSNNNKLINSNDDNDISMTSIRFHSNIIKNSNYSSGNNNNNMSTLHSDNDKIIIHPPTDDDKITQEECVSFITEMINQLTEIAFYNKQLYYFVAELYRAIQISNDDDVIQSFIHRGLSLWEYAKTVDYLEYSSALKHASDNLEAALELNENSLNEYFPTCKLSSTNLVQWIDLIEPTKLLQNQFFKYYITTFSSPNKISLEFEWCNVSKEGITLLTSKFGNQIKEISFVHCNELKDRLQIIIQNCKYLEKINIELNQDIEACDIKKLCDSCIYLNSISLIDCSGFSSEVLIWISQLKNIKEIILKGIRWLKGTSKFLYCKAETLEKINFSNSSISDSELFYLRPLYNLKYINFNCCKNLPEEMPNFISSIQSIQYLDVARAYRNTDAILSSILSQKEISLTSLDVSHCKKLTDRGLQLIGELLKKSWSSVLLYHNDEIQKNQNISLVDSYHSYLSLNDDFYGFSSISLSSCSRISEGGIKCLYSCPSVKFIQCINLAYNTGLEESCFSCLLKELHPNILTSLYLGRCKINSNTLKNLLPKYNNNYSSSSSLSCSSISLRELSIPGTSVNDLSFLFQKTPFLEKLEIKECPITDDSICVLSSSCSRLLEIDLSKCNGLKEDSIIQFVQNCKTLVQLKISHCLPVSSRIIIAISDYSRNLEFLDISENPIIADSDVIHLQNLQNLRTLILNGCHRVKSNSLICLAQSNPHLQHLHIDKTKLIDNKGAIQIVKYAKNLHEFSARETLNITRETVDWVKKYRPQISFLLEANTDVVNELTGNRIFLHGKLTNHLSTQQKNWLRRS